MSAASNAPNSSAVSGQGGVKNAGVSSVGLFSIFLNVLEPPF